MALPSSAHIDIVNLPNPRTCVPLSDNVPQRCAPLRLGTLPCALPKVIINLASCTAPPRDESLSHRAYFAIPVITCSCAKISHVRQGSAQLQNIASGQAHTELEVGGQQHCAANKLSSLKAKLSMSHLTACKQCPACRVPIGCRAAMATVVASTPSCVQPSIKMRQGPQCIE